MNFAYSDPEFARNGSFSVVDTNLSIKELNRPALSIINSDDSIQLISEDENNLNFLMGSMFASILEDTIVCMNIIDDCNEYRVKRTMLNMKALLEKKFNVEPPLIPEDVIHLPLDSDENKLEKLYADRTLCTEILKRNYKELCLNKTYTQLLDFIKTKGLQQHNPINKVVTENESHYRELKKQLRSQRHTRRLAIFDMEDTIRNMENLAADTEEMSSYRRYYMAYWQNSQKEQHKQKIQDIQETSLGSIRHYKVEYEKEMIVHDNVEKYYNILISEQMEKVEEIMDKYDTDIEHIDLELQIVRTMYTTHLEKTKALECKFKKRQKEMEEWTKFKEDRAKAQEYTNRMNRSAVIVQAWWRGLILRHGLGPFRPAKKGKKKKKSFNLE